MPRAARLTYPQGFYHIFNRGLNKEPIFRDDKDYLRLMTILSVLLSQDEWTIYAYCFMPNHYHLLVEEKTRPVAKLIGRLFTSFSQYFNRRHHRVGPLFQDRFKSKLIQKDAYFLEVSRYIHCNPVKAGLAPTPEAYPYSSLGEYMGRRFPAIIKRDKVEKLIDRSVKGMNNYIKFVRAGVNLDLEAYDPFSSHRDVLGSTAFSTHRKRVSKRLKE